MLLGDVIAHLSDETIAAETILGLGDLSLLTDMQRQAESAGLPLGAFTALLVRSFADTASDEEWTSMLGAMRRAEDPGELLLQRAFARTLAQSQVPADR